MKKFSIGIVWIIVFFAIAIGRYLGVTWYRSENYEIAGVPVLNYHAISDHFHSPLVMKVDHFKEQMDYLQKEGYQTITLDDLYDHVMTNKPLPPKPIIITFDDGYVDNYTTALPILERHNFKAVLFMIGDSVGRAGFVTKDMLVDMEKRGFQVQGHTYSHRPMPTMSDDEIKKDLRESRHVLEGIVGHPIRYLAYPRGLLDDRVVAVVKSEGYLMAFTVDPGNVKSGENLFELPRMAIFEGDFYFNMIKVRLHYPYLVAKTWKWRKDLKNDGYTELAQLIPVL